MKRRTFLQTAGYAALYGGMAADLLKSAWALTPKEVAGSDPDLHLLRRISFGPVTQELARVKSIGRSAYIDEQLTASDSLNDTAATALYPLILANPLAIYLSTVNGFAIDNHIAELQSAMLYKAMFSTAQLREVMVDFWNDHFNTYIRKNPVPLKIDFDRTVIRPNALGNFKALMRATVRHPEMLYYLDNWSNRTGAINENYAREVMELHTLGKNGGYTEADMKALARILSGLSYVFDPVSNPLDALSYGAVRFTAANHDTGAKTFLGQSFPAGGGEAEIDRALDLILSQPGTAQHIADKLCRRFVSDDPPAALVTRVAAVFTSTNGDIKQMLSTILKSQEFADSAGQKFKRPLEAMVGTVRACGLNAFDQILNTGVFGPALLGNGALAQSLQSAGQLPYSWVPPNGYPDTAAYWNNTNSLLQQERFAVTLAESISFSRLLQRPADFLLKGNSVAANVTQATTPRQAATNAVTNLLFTPLPADAMQAAVAFVAQGADPDAQMATDVLEKSSKGLVFALLSSPWFLLR